jgi:cytochrome c oxidase subunit 2
MSRSTIAAGAALNDSQNLREWLKEPDHFKQGSLMPAMQLSDQQLDELVGYLSTLH